MELMSREFRKIRSRPSADLTMVFARVNSILALVSNITPFVSVIQLIDLGHLAYSGDGKSVSGGMDFAKAMVARG